MLVQRQRASRKSIILSKRRQYSRPTRNAFFSSRVLFAPFPMRPQQVKANERSTNHRAVSSC